MRTNLIKTLVIFDTRPSTLNSLMSSTKTIDREQRALSLLKMLREDVRNAVLSSLPEDLQMRLREKVQASTQPIPSARQQQRLLDEFEDLFSFAVKLSGPKLKLFKDEKHEDDEPPEPLTGDPLVDLEQMNLYQLASALEEEQPRTVALILRNLSPGRNAKLLAELSPQQRGSVIREMSAVDTHFASSGSSRGERPATISLHATLVPAEILQKIAAKTVERASKLSPQKKETVDPMIRLADVLRESEKSLRKEYISAIQQDDPQSAEALQRHLYRFDDLVDLTDRQVQQVLSKVDSDTLQNALRGAEDEIINKVMNNLSRRAAATLSEELSYQKPVSDVLKTAARDAIAQSIGLIDEEGES